MVVTGEAKHRRLSGGHENADHHPTKKHSGPSGQDKVHKTRRSLDHSNESDHKKTSGNLHHDDIKQELDRIIHASNHAQRRVSHPPNNAGPRIPRPSHPEGQQSSPRPSHRAGQQSSSRPSHPKDHQLSSKEHKPQAAHAQGSSNSNPPRAKPALHKKRKSPIPLKRPVKKEREKSHEVIDLRPIPSVIWPLPINRVPSVYQNISQNAVEYPNHSASASNVASESTESEASNLGIGFFKLKLMDSVYICPTKNVPESILGTDCNRTYEILDYAGQRHFYAAERNLGCLGWFFGESRSFVILVYDENGETIFKFTRPMTCLICMLGVDTMFNCTHKVICSYKKVFIGQVKSVLSCCYPMYVIEDANSKPQQLLNIPTGSSWLICRMCGISEFPICNPDSGMQMGKIQLGYDGLDEETIPNPDTVSVIFPPDCDPDIKACLMAAGFLTDVTYFQRQGMICHRILMYLFVLLFLLGSLGCGVSALLYAIL